MDVTNIKIDEETAKETIQIIMAEGYLQGWQEAKTKYCPEYKKILRKGQKRGFVLGALAMVAGYIGYKKLEENKKKEAEPYEIHVEDVSDVSMD